MYRPNLGLHIFLRASLIAWLIRQLPPHGGVWFGDKSFTLIGAFLAPFRTEPDPYEPTYVGITYIFREFQCDIYQVFELRGIN